MLIPVDVPLDLYSTLYSGQAFRWRPDPGGDGWAEGVVFGNIVKMRWVSGKVEFRSSPDDVSVLEPLLRDYLRLHDDLDGIYGELGDDQHIHEGIAKYPGLRILRQEPWENLIAFICSANNNIPRISANVESMASSFGRPLSIDGAVRSTFPSPDVLAEAGEQKLRDLGLGFRAKWVSRAATAVAEGRLDLYSLREAAYDEALETLVSMDGVGDKIANCVLLFSMDKLEAFPVDVWIDRALREWYLRGDDQKMPRSRMRAWAQKRFGRYAGYANQYLFHGRRLQGKT